METTETIKTDIQEEQVKPAEVSPETPVESKTEIPTEVPAETQPASAESDIPAAEDSTIQSFNHSIIQSFPDSSEMTNEQVIDMLKRCPINEDYDTDEDYFDHAEALGLVYKEEKKIWLGTPNYEQGGQVDVTKNYYRFRQHTPKGAEECKMPDWAERVAESVKEGAKIIACKKNNKWFIQSILIPVKGVNIKNARNYAKEIRYKLQRRKKALGGTIDATDEHIEKTIHGIKLLLAQTTDEDEKTELLAFLNDLQ